MTMKMRLAVASALIVALGAAGCSVSTSPSHKASGQGQSGATKTTVTVAQNTGGSGPAQVTTPTVASSNGSVAANPTTVPSPPDPTLGSTVALFTYVSGAGFGQVKPTEVYLGGDPTGLVSHITWQSWGGAQAVGTGTALWLANGQIVAQGTEEPAQVVAFDLGTCEGHYMYQSVEWYMPQHGESFDATAGIDACDPTDPSLAHPATMASFLSPSRNVSCEISAGATVPRPEAYCQTFSPTESVTMAANGTYKTCQGTTCVGNPGIGTAVMAYGQSITVGPFTCESEPAGVTCTVAGHGFLISRSGVQSA